MNNNFWYAIVKNGDSDWGYGFEDESQAIAEMFRLNADGGDFTVCTIDGGYDGEGNATKDPICIDIYAPAVKAFVMSDVNGDIYTEVQPSIDAARKAALAEWGHWTSSEQQRNRVTVIAAEVDEDGNVLLENYYDYLTIDRFVKAEAQDIADRINSQDTWNYDDNAALCRLAGLEREWVTVDPDRSEDVVYKAAEILGVSI